MNCSSCGTPIAEGSAFCSSCGQPAPYNSQGSGQFPYDPTVAASSPSNPPQAPYTAYSAPNLPQAQDPYNAPSPFGPAANVSQNPYNPPQPASPTYGYTNAPSYPQNFSQNGQPGVFVPGYAVPPKRSGKTGLFIGLGALALLIVIGIVALSSHHSSTTATTGNTTNQASTPNTPSGQTIVHSAALIIFNPQTSSSVDQNYAPTAIKNTFALNQNIYVTFSIDSKGQKGFIKGIWYADNQKVGADFFSHNPANDVGYFQISYTSAANAAFELYWCTKADCSDAQLAQVIRFAVTSSTSSLPRPIAGDLSDASPALSLRRPSRSSAVL